MGVGLLGVDKPKLLLFLCVCEDFTYLLDSAQAGGAQGEEEVHFLLSKEPVAGLDPRILGS